MAAWEFGHVLDVLEAQGKVDACEALRSFNRNANIFVYHAFQCRDSLKDLIGDEHPEFAVFRRMLTTDRDLRGEIMEAATRSEAHLIAAVVTIRSLFDLFGLLVNESVLSGRFKITHCYFDKVVTALPPGDLRQALEAIRSSEWSKYATSFANTSKHRALVPHEFKLAGVDSNFSVGEFSDVQGGVTLVFRERFVRDVIRGMVGLKNDLVECGPLVNVALGLSIKAP